jgi:tetratricopeptide (TPR) repeat protein
MFARSPSPRAIAGPLALALLVGAVTTSEAQQPPLRQGQSPGPRFVMSALKGVGDGPQLGFQVANAVRERIASDFDMRALWVVPESTITAYLIQAGYPADQPLSNAETRQLASSFRAEELLNGVVSKTPSGYRVQAAWSLGSREDMVQPLPAVEAAKISDVARLVAREFQAARKQVESVQRCVNLARARNYTAALAEARKAIDAYPRSVLGRVCIANIYDQEKAGPDSMIRISEDILTIHPENARALAFAADAYGAKNMVDDQIRVLERLVQVEPGNHRATIALINVRASRGELDRAQPLADSLAAREPDNDETIGVQWRTHLAAKDWTRVLVIGEHLVDIDSSAATHDFFIRMIAAADAIGDPRKALDLATRGVGRFPDDDELIVLRVQSLRRNGQLPQARAVVNALVERHPAAPNAWTQKARIDLESGLGADSVLASLGRALRNADDRTTLAGTARAFGVAVSRDTMPNKIDPLRIAVRYYRIALSAQAGDTTSFLIGQASVILAQRLATQSAASRTCDVAKEMQTLMVDAQIELPKGGRAFPKETPPLMTAAGQLSTYADQLAKAVCR